VWIDKGGRVLVADRENERVQVFDKNGELLTIWPTNLIGQAVIYVDAANIVYIVEHNADLVSVLTLEVGRLAQWDDPASRSCHGIWDDFHGDFYIMRARPWGQHQLVVKHVRLHK
jgi:peptidylglycine monooxygenase